MIFKNTLINNKLAVNSQFIFGILTIAFTFFVPYKSYAQNTAAPVVVELFTSKYCPACPPADENLNKLAQNPNIIALACHVTYFDRGARKDPLSKPFCNARQSIYSNTLKTKGIYTPMMIINGKKITKGTRYKQTQSLIQKSQNKQNQPAGFRKIGEYLDITLPRTTLNQDADIWLIEIEKDPAENGKTHNAVKNITKLLRWNGRALKLAFPVPSTSTNAAYALIAQNNDGIITAAKTGF